MASTMHFGGRRDDNDSGLRNRYNSSSNNNSNFMNSVDRNRHTSSGFGFDGNNLSIILITIQLILNLLLI